VENSDSQKFITRWKSSGAAERANYQLFLSELCDIIGVARPDPTKPDDAENAYVFERSVTFHHPDGTTSTGRIDLYKRACFVLEAKQGVEKREAAEALAEATRAKAKAAKKGHAQRGSTAWDEAMLKARGQAEQYARALPASEGRHRCSSSWMSGTASNSIPSSPAPAAPTSLSPIRKAIASCSPG